MKDAIFYDPILRDVYRHQSMFAGHGPLSYPWSWDWTAAGLEWGFTAGLQNPGTTVLESSVKNAFDYLWINHRQMAGLAGADPAYTEYQQGFAVGWVKGTTFQAAQPGHECHKWPHDIPSVSRQLLGTRYEAVLEIDYIELRQMKPIDTHTLNFTESPDVWSRVMDPIPVFYFHIIKRDFSGPFDTLPEAQVGCQAFLQHLGLQERQPTSSPISSWMMPTNY